MNYLKKCDELLVVFSDIEMGGGGKTDDFPHSRFLVDLILGYNEPQFNDVKVRIVFNGDTFDFLKTKVNGGFPHHINEKIACDKLSIIADAHKVFFDGLREFLRHSSGRRTAHFIVGNHDPEILFPGVQAEIKRLCDNKRDIVFEGLQMNRGDVHIEHGSQYDALFKMDVEKPFIFHKGETFLHLPWASVTLLEVMMPLHEHFWALDRIKPKKLLFEIIPEMRELIVSSFWNYWTKDFIKQYLRSSDPLKRISWSMIKEVVKRTTIFNPDVEIERYFQRRMLDSEAFRLYIVGHMHEICVFGFGNRKIIQAGCFRDEFMLENSAKSMRPIPKSYVEVFMKDNRLINAHLVELDCPTLTEDLFPPFPQYYLPKIHELLGSSDERLKSRLDIEHQEEIEES